MRQIRAHVFHYVDGARIDTDVFRDIDQAIEAGLAYMSGGNSVCFHIGIGRPTSDAVGQAISPTPPRVYLTEAARWVLPELYVRNCQWVAEVPSTVLGKELPLYKALSGWGYEEVTSSEVFSSSSASVSISVPPGWVRDNLSAIPVLSEVGVVDDDTYWGAYRQLETSVRSEADAARRTWLLEQFTHTSCTDMVKRGPSWFRTLPLECLPLKVRTSNVLNEQHFESVVDLEPWTDARLLKLRSFGRLSLEDLRSQLLNALLAGPPEVQESVSHGRNLSKASEAVLSSVWSQLRRACTDKERREPIERLNLGTRSSNVLHQAQIRTVGELLDYGTEGLLDMANLGITSLREIAGCLTYVIEVDDLPNDETATTADSREQPTASLELAHEIPLATAVSRTLAILDPDHARIVKGRLGAGGELLTLNELGSEVGLTKERVRQIARKSIGHIVDAELWDDVLRDKIAALLADRHRPLTPDLLMALDPWFAGFEDDTRFLCGIIRAFGEGQFHCWDLEGIGQIITRVTESDFRVMQEHLRAVVIKHLGAQPTVSEVKDAAKSVTIGEGAVDLFEPLVDLLLEVAVLADAPKDDERRILSLSGTVRELCMHVLEQSPAPIHFSEVTERVSVLARRSVSESVVQGVLGQDAFLFGRGCYGLRAHLGIDGESIREVQEIAREAIVSGPTGRQWHCEEICDIIMEANVLPRSVTPYEVSIMLEKTEGIEYLGRLVWMACNHSAAEEATRASIAEIVESAIEDAGRPLSNEEIWAAVTRVRGISTYRLVPETDRVVRMRRGVFGLIDRDIGVDEKSMNAWLKVIAKELDQEGELALEDIEALAVSEDSNCISKCDPAVLCRLAAKAGVGRVVRGNRLVGSEG